MNAGLANFVHGLNSKNVCVEMRKSNYAFGILDSCDSQMNLRVSKARLFINKKVIYVDNFFIMGKHVRFIRVDRDVDVNATIKRSFNEGKKGVKVNKRLDMQQSLSTRKTFT